MAFLSHTSDLTAFVAAAMVAVREAGWMPVEMGEFTAQDRSPAQYCVEQVEGADVYVGILGSRYGSLVPGRTAVSYTELEFDTATHLEIERRLFRVAPGSEGSGTPDSPEDAARQAAFLERVRSLLAPEVRRPDELGARVLQALRELAAGSLRPNLESPPCTHRARGQLLRGTAISRRGALAEGLVSSLPIPLTLVAHPDLVDRRDPRLPWAARGPEFPLIRSAYEEYRPTLLVAGEAGVGKTTFLHKLGANLARRAERGQGPLPVLLHLSSWPRRRSSLEEWIAARLRDLHDVRIEEAEALVGRKSCLALLLDGLSEMPLAAVTACCDAIEAFRRTHPTTPIVVATRTGPYLDQDRRLRLNGAVVVRPPSLGVVRAVLRRGDAALGDLDDALDGDEDLAELRTRPQFLWAAAKVAGAARNSTPAEAGDRPWRDRILDEYVRTALTERSGHGRLAYPQDRVRRWLQWMAVRVRREPDRTLFPDWMQPDWLPGPGLRVAAVAGPVLAVAGLAAALTPLAGGLLGLSGAFGPILAAALFGAVQCYPPRIRLRPEMTWSWRSALRQAPAALLVGACIGLVVVLLDVTGDPAPRDALAGLACAMALSLLLVGRAGTAQTTRLPHRPREAVGRTARSAVLRALVIVVLPCASIATALEALGGDGASPLRGLADAVTAFGFLFPLFWLLEGGSDVLRHVAVRAALAADDLLPWRCWDFLDDAVDRDLLDHVGGGYTFAGDVLVDYFASRANALPGPAASRHRWE